MKKYKKILVLAATTTLILSGCDNNNSTSTSSIDSSSNTSTSVSSSSTISRGSWSSDAEKLLVKYCGEVLPYPEGFEGDIKLEELEDSTTNHKYLQITDESIGFSLGEYYLDLENSNWTGIKNYSGSVEQEDSNGTTYFEYIKQSNDKKIGYDITYFFYKNSTTNKKYNVIQCYNDLDTSLDSSSDWSSSEKETFNNTITFTPSKFKLGVNKEVYASTEDFMYAKDLLAEDLTQDNVKILENDGWVIDQDMSKDKNAYILKKQSSDGNYVYAKVYYFGGNYVTFTYEADIKESSSWPKEFVSSFETSTGFTIPQFTASDINKYYYYTKNGVSYIFSYTESTSIYPSYEDLLKNTDALFDNENRWYTSWDEKFTLKAESTIDYNNYLEIFRISFKQLDKPYDDLLTSWPSTQIDKFLTKNNLSGVTIPSFDLSSYSMYSSLRVSSLNYEDAYKQAYQAIKEDPTSYDLDEDASEEDIKAIAEEVAKSNTKISIKAYDKLVNSDPNDSSSEKVNKVYEYLSSELKKIGWSRVNGNGSYDLAYEDPTGKVLLGVTKINGVTSIEFTYGSGQAHSPSFYFVSTNVSVELGSSVKLNLVCDMLNGNITYTSSSDKFTVDSNGKVTPTSSASSGDETIITASILADGESTPRTATCRVSIPFTYTPSNTVSKIAGLYNNYFNLTSSDSGYVTPNSDNSFTVYPSSITSISDAETFVMNNLVPGDFFNGDETKWDSDSSSSLGDYEYMEYIAYNEDDTAVLLTFKVFTTSDGSIGINVIAEDW